MALIRKTFDLTEKRTHPFHLAAKQAGSTVVVDAMSSPSSLKLHDDAWYFPPLLLFNLFCANPYVVSTRSYRITSPARQRPAEPTVEFVDEKTVSQCMACNSMFTLVVKKHHCVSCGKVYCGKCSKVRAHSEQGVLMRQRFCIVCEEQCASRSIITRGNQKVLWKQRNSSPRLKQAAAPPPVVPLDGSQPIQRRKSGTCSCSVHVQQPISATAILCTIKPRKKVKKAKETAVMTQNQTSVPATGRRSQCSNSSSGGDDGLSSRSISPVPLYGVCTTPTAVPLGGTADCNTSTSSAYALYSETSYLDQTTSTVDCSVQCPTPEEDLPAVSAEWDAKLSSAGAWRAEPAVTYEERTLNDTVNQDEGQSSEGGIATSGDGNEGVPVQTKMTGESEEQCRLLCSRTPIVLSELPPMRPPLPSPASKTQVWRYVAVICATMVMTALMLRLGDAGFGLLSSSSHAAVGVPFADLLGASAQTLSRSYSVTETTHSEPPRRVGPRDGYRGQPQEGYGAYEQWDGQQPWMGRDAETIAAGLSPWSTRLKLNRHPSGATASTGERGAATGRTSGSISTTTGIGVDLVRGSSASALLEWLTWHLIWGGSSVHSNEAGTPLAGRASSVDADGRASGGGRPVGTPSVAVSIVFVMEEASGSGLRRVGSLLRRLGRALWQPLREGVEDVDYVYL